MMRDNVFEASHPFELGELRRALVVAIGAGHDRSGIMRSMLDRVARAQDAADALDRARQLEGYRAAND